jgi:hypothetical protein
VGTIDVSREHNQEENYHRANDRSIVEQVASTGGKTHALF